MLKKSRRLRAAEVEMILRQGRSFRAVFTTAKALPLPDATIRIAAVVPKSVAPKATQRTSLRRALYDAGAAAQKEHRGSGAQIVFFVRQIPPLPRREAFRKDVDSILGSCCGVGRKK